jgi:hypothetical protein
MNIQTFAQLGRGYFIGHRPGYASFWYTVSFVIEAPSASIVLLRITPLPSTVLTTLIVMMLYYSPFAIDISKELSSFMTPILLSTE